ncbi:hypothetical protein P3342_003140 [Pyrenophora teres f. teres]|uniref:Mitochondrial carrier protein pet8 protein n=1 Tax=Pyrenophora teres f. teres TaxID=97479 RepID=A0A6S6VVP3_9PLEO|nr:hypothetical protein HRS9139_01692 [Pyrenophora teres f. teres]CAA9958291.1 hypothetical protein PTMSG1_01853 [Pyrenophora teres f. maculata]KAE8850542.1 hypothetical protein PTNB85_00958 [Pyrenophora teres f. teres]KAE8851433.1 hypothetical protein HRS9122_01720 [Pyrenophora teres f. teres]KAE8870096.1 hypothetical protein PTNB29_00440 [Pyrenophora teres f. teres]
MSAIRAFATRRAPFVFAQRAAFSQSIARPVGKESALHNEGRAEEVEKKKQEHLSKQKEGKGQWEEQLASDSESAVKADRSETGQDTKEQIKKLQEEAKKV